MVLYAPTHRPDREYAPGRYLLDLEIDLDDAREALGEDHVLLVRPHPKVVDSVPDADGTRVVDVTEVARRPGAMVAADVLVTDYSSVMVDFAHTGRPMVFWTPDGDYYREHLRAVYVDPAELPGPTVETAEDMLAAVAAATRDGQPAYDDAYRSFRERYAPPGDGKATARAVDASSRADQPRGTGAAAKPQLRRVRGRPARVERVTFRDATGGPGWRPCWPCA